MDPLEEKIIDLITPAMEETGFELIRVRITGARTKTLQIMAESPDGTMTAENCATVSRAISTIFEESDPIEGKYTLEVSSPGIDRPLTREKDFINWEGHEARLELDRMIEGRKNFKGTLAGYEEGNVAFDIAGEEETALFPREWIVNAKLIMTDMLIRQSLKNSPLSDQTLSDDGPENDTQENDTPEHDA